MSPSPPTAPPPSRMADYSARLDVLLRLPPAARADWLASLPPADADLLPLLRAAGGLDDADAASPGADDLDAQLGDGKVWSFRSGHQVGPYALIAPLGQGGMGEVWRARRHDGALAREVALKLPHTWLLTAGARLRLARERDILASLNHPNIAQLHDAGIAADGQPWLALERVEGQRIDLWCRARKLSIAERLRLFLQVTDAVAFAHARLTVHRDLKPSNILVADDGKVKLLDFGIAKLLSEDGRGELTEITRISGRLATPEYAAPEQLGDAPITAATDIYSLGVVLHELLTGSRPPAQRRPAGVESARNQAMTLTLASTRIDPAFVAGLGRDARHWRRQLGGDLDAILVRATRLDPAARYASVERFANDLRRHLDNLPIEARHIGRAELAWKFIRRNAIPLAAATLVALSVLGGGAASLWQARRATAAAELAQREAQRANATRDLVLEVFRANSRLDAETTTQGAITARQMLDRIVDTIETRLAGQPEAQLELLASARKLYRQWYLPDQASKAHRLYRAIVSRRDGPDSAAVIDSLIEEAGTLYESDRISAATVQLDEAGRRIAAGGHAGSRLEGLWLMERGRFAASGRSYDIPPEAESHFARGVEILRASQAPPKELAWALIWYTDMRRLLGKPEGTQAMMREALAIGRSMPEANDWLIANAELLLALADFEAGDVAAAEAGLRGVTDKAFRTFGKEFNPYWDAELGLIELLAVTDREPQARARIAREREALAGNNLGAVSSTAVSGNNIDRLGLGWMALETARIEARDGDCRAEIPMLLETARETVGILPEPRLPATLRLVAGQCLWLAGKVDAARVEIDAAHRFFREDRRMETRPAQEAALIWAKFHLAQGDTARQAAGSRELEALATTALSRPNEYGAEALLLLAEQAGLRGEPAQAARLSTAAADVLSRTRRPMPAAQRAALRARIEAAGASPLAPPQ